jgi:uncharacterized protein YfaS (alpha-2-macroglobulin family)
VRDDRVLTYFDLERGHVKVFLARINAGYAGEFILPAVQVEAMYNATKSALAPGGRVRVIPAEK